MVFIAWSEQLHKAIAFSHDRREIDYTISLHKPPRQRANVAAIFRQVTLDDSPADT